MHARTPSRRPAYRQARRTAFVLLMATTPPLLAAPPPEGRLLAAQCAQCHGTDGRAVAGFEKLAGENARGIYNDLLEMKYRWHPEGIMDLQARGYSDDQLWLIAQYYATQPEKTGEGSGSSSEHDDEHDDD